MNQLEYLPGIGGQSVQLDGPSSFVGIAENLRSREWEYDLGYRDLVSATRPAREVDVTFQADYETADDFRRVADADVTARTPGVFLAQNEWKQRGYVLASKPNDIHFGRLSTELKIALLDGAWWRLVSRSFNTGGGVTPEIEYDSATGKSVTTTGAAYAPLHALTVDGEAVQDGTPTPSNPVDVQVVGPVNGSFGISVNGTVTQIDLQGNVLASLPDGTKDVLTVDSVGHCVLEKRVGKSIFNGSENWYSITAGGRVALTKADILQNANANSKIGILCDYFVEKTMAESYSQVGISSSNGVQQIVVRPSTGNTSVADWKTWLQTHNVTAYYQLATPQTIDLGTISMPMLTDGATITITAQVTPTITAEWQKAEVLELDYPHDYPHDYAGRFADSSVETSVLTPSAIRLVIYGPAENPEVTVGGNTYQVNVTVPDGGYTIIDGREKTIITTLANGTTRNDFAAGVRGGGAGSGEYIFEPIARGEQAVTWDGTFGFDLGWYEEEGEPPWSQS